MRLLLFEYITGGGFNQQELPVSLLKEGNLMLQAVLSNLQTLHNIETTVLLDARLSDDLSLSAEIIYIQANDNIFLLFEQMVKICDVVLPIAPEFDSILTTLCQLVRKHNKILFNSPAEMVALTSNKWLTYLALKQHHIKTVETTLWHNHHAYSAQQEWVIKPIDGAGSNETYIVREKYKLDKIKQDNIIMQPHIIGEKISLSALFKQGQAWLLCANQQHFSTFNDCYHLESITVNYTDNIEKYQPVLQQVAQAFTDLWGYVGIDLIETEREILVLEINPRLTSSFAGIAEALGINVMEQLFYLLQGTAKLSKVMNKQVKIMF